MNIVVIFAIVVIALFAILFVSRRKFGLLGLALAAGSILSNLWFEKASYVLGMLNAPSGIFVVNAVAAAIIILPAMLMIFHDGKYKTKIGQLIGSGLFALLAMAFLIDPIGRLIIPQGIGATFYEWLVMNNGTIIATCLVLAIIDLLLPKHNHSHEKHHSY